MAEWEHACTRAQRLLEEESEFIYIYIRIEEDRKIGSSQ